VGNRWATIAAALVWCAAPVLADCRADQVEVRLPSGGMARFAVEVADDGVERAQGLMFREHMAKSAGMLFIYDAPQHASFWMKNTVIPLDMIFADPQGRVTAVHADAVPGDTTPIDGGDGVQLILEINGGLAARMGIVPGAELRHPAIAQGAAVWPCAAN
jgi:uncharacterized protein